MVLLTSYSAQSPGIRRILVERGLPAERVEVLYNWTEETADICSEPDSALLNEIGLHDSFNVLLPVLWGEFNASTSRWRLQLDLPDIAPHVRFLFVGGGVEVPSLIERSEAEVAQRHFSSAAGPGEHWTTHVDCARRACSFAG